jgi:hypothetical protein
MDYNFREIEKKWQKRWVEQKTYQVTEDESKKKFYVLNMFPTLPAQDYMWDTRWGTLLRIFTLVTNDCRASTFSIPWDTMLTVCRRTIRHTNRSASGYHNRQQHQPIQRTA